MLLSATLPSVASRQAVAAVAVAVVSVVGASCGKQDRTRQISTSSRITHDTSDVVSCAEAWVPNARTFANHEWRRGSQHLGPLTLLNSKELAPLNIGSGRTVKIRTLVRPRTEATLAISNVSSGARVGIGVTEAARSTILSFSSCPPVPKYDRVISTIADNGFPLYISVTRPTCIEFTVSASGQEVTRGVGIGRRCSSSSRA
jgi:hypothetical protein